MNRTGDWLQRFLPVIAISCLVVAAGCSKHPELNKLPTVPVRGIVTLNGKPITYGQGHVTLLRADGQTLGVDNWSARGSIHADGSYEVFTRLGLNHGYSGLLAMKRGAPAGHYLVTVEVTEPWDAPNGPRRAKPKSLIPKRYASRRSSGLVIEVRADADRGAYDLHLHN